MTPEIFAEWLRRQGHRIIKTDSSYWYDQGPGVLQAFPYHWEITPTEEELRDLLVSNHIIGLRYSTPIQCPSGAISYHTIFNEPEFKIDHLGKRTRKNIRRGIKNCSILPVPLEKLGTDGWDIRQDTLDRQGRLVKHDKGNWYKRCLMAVDLPGFESWGAYIEKKLVAAILTFQMEECCYIIEQFSLRDYLSYNVNNAVSYIVTTEMISRMQINCIFYGLHSLDAPESIDQFKFHMGYKAKPVRQRVVFHPWLTPIFNKTTHLFLRRAHDLRPGSPLLAKAEGMVRFYLQGMQPLEKQPLPHGLREEQGILSEQDF
jgi:hypothetical protein